MKLLGQRLGELARRRNRCFQEGVHRVLSSVSYRRYRLSRQVITNRHTRTRALFDQDNIARHDLGFHGIAANGHAVNRTGIASERSIELAGIDQNVRKVLRSRPT